LLLFAVARGQFIGECSVLVAHGWNVDYSALSQGWVSLVLLRRGKRDAGLGGVGHAVGFSGNGFVPLSAGCLRTA